MHLSAVWFDASSESEKRTDRLRAILQSASGIRDVWCSSVTNWDPSAHLGWARVTSNGIASVGVCLCDAPVALGRGSRGWGGRQRALCRVVPVRLNKLPALPCKPLVLGLPLPLGWMCPMGWS